MNHNQQPHGGHPMPANLPHAPVRTGHTLVAGQPAAGAVLPPRPPKKPMSKAVIGLIVVVSVLMLSLAGTCGWLIVRPVFVFHEMIEDTFAQCGPAGSDAKCQAATGTTKIAATDISGMRTWARGFERAHGKAREFKFGKFCSNAYPGKGRVEATIVGEKRSATVVFFFRKVDGEWALEQVLSPEEATRSGDGRQWK